jgi:hypothetical protein
MDRRNFLRKLGIAGPAAVGAVAVSAAGANPDRFEHDGWLVQWPGWQAPPNQRVVYGYWSASRVGDASGEFWYCTTMGACRHAYRMDMLDLSTRDGWPVLDGLHAEADAERVKRLARERLLKDGVSDGERYRLSHDRDWWVDSTLSAVEYDALRARLGDGGRWRE